MDASPAELGIHGQDGDKNRVYSICCHGCPDPPKMGIHEGIHEGIHGGKQPFGWHPVGGPE
jgi:hypothetical protein